MKFSFPFVRLAVPGAALAAALALSGPAQAQSLFDAIGSLFGGGRGSSQPAPGPAPAQAYRTYGSYGSGGYGDRGPWARGRYEEGARPLEMTVGPRRGRGGVASRPKRERAPREVATAKVIDPKTNPKWYLEDPTLRRGDIVVLPGRVLVYEGRGGPVEEADYASLDRSALSKQERQRIRAMAGLPADGAQPPEVKPVAQTTPTEDLPRKVTVLGDPANPIPGLNRP
ncbi:MAG: hypothetical protein JO048_04245 [Methylobacteriaceae bacterium]|nr:hypothetical protein [Methylobacteriaceae bacterium]